MARNSIYSVDLDFKNAAKAADEFASKLDSSISDALKQNRGFTNLMTGFSKVNKLQESFGKKHKKYQELENLRQKKNSGELLKSIHDITKQQEELNKKKSKSVDLSKEEKEELEKQEKTLKTQLESAEQLLSVAESSVAEHAALAKELVKETKSLEAMAEHIAQSAESAKEIKTAFKNLADPTKFGEKLEGLSEKAGEAFKDGIDVQSLSRDLGKGLGKGINTAFKAMSGGSGAIMALGGAIAGVVAGLGIMLAAFIAVDKKVKEFNKGIIKTHGALSVMRLGGGDLNRGLQVVKHTVMDLTGTLGLSEQEATELLDTLDKGGLTLSRLTQGARNATQQQEMLTRSLRDINAIAGASGVSLSEYTDNLTNYVNDLAMSTQTVNDSFASIAKMASESAFSTRRFYSMVVQATSGQSALNVSMDKTGDLLLRMSRIMGAKKATEAVSGAAGGMGAMSAQERLRTLTIAGGRGSRIFNRQAVQSAQTFSTANHGLSSAFTQALERAGLTSSGIGDAFSSSNPQRLVQSLGRMSAREQRSMLTELRESGVEGTEGMARQLEELANLSRGGTSAHVGSAGGLGAGANLAMTAATLRTFMDPSGRLSAPQRIAAESVTSMGGPQMDSFLSEMQSLQGEFERMQGGGETGEKLIKEYQLTRRSDGSLVDQLGHVIRSSDDLFMTQRAQDAHDLEKIRDEATQLAYQTMDATVSVADILENKIAVYIQRIYEWASGWLGPLLLKLPGMGSERAAFEKKRATTGALETEIEKILKQGSDAREAMTRAQTKVGTETDPVARRRAREELDTLQQQQRQRDQTVHGLREASSRIAGGNTYDTRAFRVTRQAHEVGQRGSGEMGRTTAVEGVDRSFRTREEAEAFNRTIPGGSVSEEQMDPARVLARVLAGVGATPTPSVPGTAPVIPGTAAPSPTATPAPPVPAHVEAATAPVVEQAQDAQQQAQTHHQQDVRAARTRDRQAQVTAEKILKGRELGDGLAMSKLPDAIAEADAKIRLTEALFKGKVSEGDITKILSGHANQVPGAAENADYGSLVRSRDYRAAASTRDSSTAAMAHDFISQDRGGRTVITPIDRADQVTGQKPGGPIAAATARGAGGNVNISINGGDERRVFEVVRRAIRQAGITPNRVPSGAS